MRALTRGITTASVLIVAFGLTAGTAEAKGPGASEAEVDTRGKRSGSVLVSVIRYSSTTTGGGGKGNVTPVGNWTPPACWYEPRSADEFSKYVENM
ncbi:hypothetical protein [Streptomyces venetus]|uniref:hypothetical protein n=1 Tax=Streptomyces venetus TaxID=1701086 RepID=UPI003C2F8532